MSAVVSKFAYLRNNLSIMAELSLEQVISMVEMMEEDDYARATKLIERDDEIDELEKENDNQSQNAILEAVASREELRRELATDPEAARDPLIFALSAIRLTRSFERMGDHVVNAARAFRNESIRKGLFCKHERLSLILSRTVTVVGISVESLVEQKDRFFGSIQKIEDELDAECNRFFLESVESDLYTRREFADLYRILLSVERIGDIAVNVAMELVRLNTGQDLRHLFPSITALDHA